MVDRISNPLALFNVLRFDSVQAVLDNPQASLPQLDAFSRVRKSNFFLEEICAISLARRDSVVATHGQKEECSGLLALGRQPGCERIGFCCTN